MALDAANPINWQHPSNLGLVVQYAIRGHLTDSRHVRDLCSVKHPGNHLTFDSALGGEVSRCKDSLLCHEALLASTAVSKIPSLHSPITLSAVINLREIAVGANSALMELHYVSGTETITFQMADTAGANYVATDSTSFSETISGAQIPSVNRLHQLDLTHDGAGNFEYYLDGQPSKSFAWGVFGTDVAADTLGICGRTGAASGFMRCYLHSAGIYNRVLTPTQIGQLFVENVQNDYKNRLNWLSTRTYFGTAAAPAASPLLLRLQTEGLFAGMGGVV